MSTLSAVVCVVTVWVMCREQNYVYRRGFAIALTIVLLGNALYAH